MLHIAALMTNTPSNQKPLAHQHGLSLLVEYNDVSLLFDAGSDEAFIENAEDMGYSLDNVKAVVLSHSHYDHTGGYKEMLKDGTAPSELFLGPDFFDRKYIKRGQRYSNANGSFTAADLKKAKIKVKEVSTGVRLDSGLYIVAGFNNKHKEERIPDSYLKYRDNEFIKDDFSDEICLIARTRKGLVVITGSSHIGIINMLDKINNIFKEPIYAIIGGINVKPNQNKKKEFTLAKFKEMGVKIVGYCYDGEEALKDFTAEGIDVNIVAVGDEFFIE